MSQTPDLAADDGEAELDDGSESEGETAATNEEQETPTGDITEAEVKLTEDDLGGSLFDGVETADGSNKSESGGEEEPGPIADGLSGNAGAMEDAINEGAARASVIGLTQSDLEGSELDKETLEAEFQETFQAFRLGYFGSRAVEEYFLEPADSEVAPIWGLLGSALIAGAMVVWLRPDGDQAIVRARNAVSSMAGGGS